MTQFRRRVASTGSNWRGANRNGEVVQRGFAAEDAHQPLQPKLWEDGAIAPPAFADTLAKICADVDGRQLQLKIDVDLVPSGKSRLAARRPTPINPLAVAPKTVGGRTGTSRTSDVRSYGTLDQLLSPGWQPPTIGDAVKVMLPSLVPAGGSNPFSARPGTESGRGRVVPRPVTEAAGGRLSARPGAEAWLNKRLGPNRPGTEASRRRIPGWPDSGASTARESQRRGLAEGNSSSGFNSTAKSESGLGPLSPSILEQLQKPIISGEWNMLLGFAGDKSGTVRAEGNGQDINVEDLKRQESSSSSSPRVRTLQGRATGSTAFNIATGERAVTVITQPTSESWRTAGFQRPPSPMRPGVYNGHNATGHPQQKLPAGLPLRAASSSSTSVPGIPDALARFRAFGGPPGSGQPMWCSMLEQSDPERKSDEAKAYEAWRKRVIECTRNMQMEVARFKLEDRLEDQPHEGLQ